jgi:hypothetical protein
MRQAGRGEGGHREAGGEGVTVRIYLLVLGLGIGVLIGTALPFWPACLSGNDYVSGYSLWRASPTLEIGWSLLLPLLLTVFLGVGGGIVGRSVAATIEDRRTEKRAAEGRCFRCGFSLTGNTSGVCPECGTPVPKEPAEKSHRPT